MKTSDADLLMLAKKDNEIAFKQLYDRHWKRLYVFSFKFLKNESEAKDVVQEVFCMLWSKRRDLEIREVKPYLFASTKFKCLEYLKKERLTVFLNHVNLFIQDDSLEKEMSFKDTQVKLQRGIDSLPEKSKRIFKMSRYQELSNKEIAHELDISIKTVEYHITQCIKRLRLDLAS